MSHSGPADVRAGGETPPESVIHASPIARGSRWAWVAVFAGLAGCAGHPPVARIVDGHVIEGRYVDEETYAAVLDASIAEAGGETTAAERALERAAESGADLAQVWAALGALRCRRTPNDHLADEAFERALSIDSRSELAWLERARCAELRRNVSEAERAFARAAALAPLAVDPQQALGRSEANRGHRERARARLVALTLLHRENPSAWRALATWARTTHDAALELTALVELARRAPGDDAELSARATSFGSSGRLDDARALAAAIVDRTDSGRALSRSLSRLAIDEAALRGDEEAVRRRTVRCRLDPLEVAGRALLMSRDELAEKIASLRVTAEPNALAGHLVLMTVAHRTGELSPIRRVPESAAGKPWNAPLPVVLAWLDSVARAATSEVARGLFEALPRPPLDDARGDALVTQTLVELAARGVIDGPLPREAQIELALRRGVAPPEPDDQTDLRHTFLALVVLRPGDPKTAALGAELSLSAASDPLVAAGIARQALARGLAVEPTLAQIVHRAHPSDPITAAVGVAIERARPGAALTKARVRLSALARTDAERALLVE